MNQTLPFGGSYTANWQSNRFTHDEPVPELQPAAHFDVESLVHAAADAELHHRSDPPAGAEQHEDSRPVGHSAAFGDHADRSQCEGRVLGSRVCDRQPQGAAGIARAVAAIAEGQPEARRNRHAGAVRRRAVRSGGRGQRAGRHHRDGQHSNCRGQSAHAHPRSGCRRLLDRRFRADRHAGVSRPGDRRRRRRAEQRSTSGRTSFRRRIASSRATSISATSATRSSRTSTHRCSTSRPRPAARS